MEEPDRCFPTMSTAYSFNAPDDAACRLKTLSGHDLLSFLQQILWSYLQSIVCSTADFESIYLCSRILEALPSELDDVYNEVTRKTDQNELIRTFLTDYCEKTSNKRFADQIVRNCVYKWLSPTSNDTG